VTGHPDRGKGRNGVFGEMNVVEADEREIVGDAQIGFKEGMLDADGGHVVRTHDGSRPSGLSEDLLHGVVATVKRVVAFYEPIGIGLEAGGL